MKVDEISERCTAIADRLYEPPLRCYGWKAKIWQAAWDGACIALGGDPEDYLCDLSHVNVLPPA